MRPRLHQQGRARRVRSRVLPVRRRVPEPKVSEEGLRQARRPAHRPQGTRPVHQAGAAERTVHHRVHRRGAARGRVQVTEGEVRRGWAKALLLHDAVVLGDHRRGGERQRGSFPEPLLRSQLRDAKVDGERRAVHRHLRPDRHRRRG